MTRASIAPTLLSLERYAKILGLDPLHFATGVSQVRPSPTCSDVWYQYNWQDGNKVSREHIADLINEAEQDLADELGYWLAPTWIEDERMLYPGPQRPEVWGGGGDIKFRYKSIQTKWGYVLYGGRRATTLLGTADWTGVDVDSDGFNEIARITLTVPATTSQCEVKVYFHADDRTDPASTGADPVWEIRDIDVTLVGTTLTVRTASWNLLRPVLQEALSLNVDADDGVIDADDPDSYVEEVELYRVYNDASSQVQFLWGEGDLCGDVACAWATQEGCIRVNERRNGLVVPQPGDYDTATSTYAQSSWSEDYEPDALRLWYRAGYVPERAYVCEYLTDFWARQIAILATARTDWPLCTCSNVTLLSDKWRQDMALIKPDRSYMVTPGDLENPLGTRYGEALVWKKITKGRGRKKGQAILPY